VLIRMRRVLGPPRAPHWALSPTMAALAVTAPLLPLLATCPPGLT
jgi:hypothetical protein